MLTMYLGDLMYGLIRLQYEYFKEYILFQTTDGIFQCTHTHTYTVNHPPKHTLGNHQGNHNNNLDSNAQLDTESGKVIVFTQRQVRYMCSQSAEANKAGRDQAEAKSKGTQETRKHS